MQECFLSWVKHLSDKLEVNVISIDGKTARGSYDREGGLKALHTVSAWASEHHLVLAQQAVESKSNEITAIPELLNLLDITGAIITLDAMGTQRNIAAQIIEQKGEYILALKGNQGNLHKKVVAFFEQAHRYLYCFTKVSRSKNFFGVREHGGFSRYSYLLRDCQNQPFSV